MSQIFRPTGLNIASYIGGKPRNATKDIPLQLLNNTNTATFCSGDPVGITTGGVTFIVPATAYPPSTSPNAPQGVEAIFGVWQSVSYQPAQQNVPAATFAYWVAGTATANNVAPMVSINCQPGQVYIIQCNATLTNAAIGRNFNLAQEVNTGTSQNGFTSQCCLNTATLSGGTNEANWGQVKVIGLAKVTPAMQALGGNAWGDPFPWVEVIINNSTFHLGSYGQ